jgi:hypothetical protein
MFRRTRKTEPAAVAQLPAAAAASAIAAPRSSSKLGIVLGLLQSTEGTSLTKLVSVTNWQPHTMRAALTGLRKRGYAITIEKIVPPDGVKSSVYRIAAGQAQ